MYVDNRISMVRGRFAFWRPIECCALLILMAGIGCGYDRSQALPPAGGIDAAESWVAKKQIAEREIVLLVDRAIRDEQDVDDCFLETHHSATGSGGVGWQGHWDLSRIDNWRIGRRDAMIVIHPFAEFSVMVRSWPEGSFIEMRVTKCHPKAKRLLQNVKARIAHLVQFS